MIKYHHLPAKVKQHADRHLGITSRQTSEPEPTLCSLAGASHGQAQSLISCMLELVNAWPGRLRARLLERTLSEFHAASRVFAPFGHVRKVAFFGSARTKSRHVEYELAIGLATQFVESDFMVITGAGPGIMAAAQKGAGANNSFGLRILLPFHNPANDTIADNSKMVEFEYYFTRKISFAWESDAFVVFPGGLGTLDETFEILTMMQTGKTPIVPVIMVERPGGNFWAGCQQFLEKQLVQEGHLSPDELALFAVCSEPERALDHIKHFYGNYHSYQWHDDQLVIYIRNQLTAPAILDLNQRFASLLAIGSLEQMPASGTYEKPIGPNPYRITLSPHKRRYGQIRRLIDAINDAPVTNRP